MKSLLLTVLLLMSQMSFSKAIVHSISRGKLHKGGTITISIQNKTEDSFFALLKYDLKVKALVPIPKKFLKGDLLQPLPISFESEYGYLQLEEAGKMDVTKAKLVHMGRVDMKSYPNAHKVKIIPTNNQWVGVIYYHPSVDSIGWLRAEITLIDIPIVGDYPVLSTLK